jgi:hypothetical protein
VATWAILPALGIVWGGFHPSARDKEFYLKLLVIGPIAFGFTTLAIPFWALGKRPILEIVSDPGSVKALQGIGLIISLILTGVLYMQGIGSNQ